MAYLLEGDFVECCDCFTVCPCWVSDLPDEDHCSGLYLWSFDNDSTIDNIPVTGMHIAAASYHAVRAGGQAMFFVDAGSGDDKGRIERLIYNTFTSRDERSDFAALSRLLGVNLGYKPAQITSRFTGSNFEVMIAVNGQVIATAEGHHKQLEGQTESLRLKGSGLNEPLGLGQRSVKVQRMEGLTMDVAALPGGALNFRGRSGMRSRFNYAYGAVALLTDPGDAPDIGQEG